MLTVDHRACALALFFAASSVACAQEYAFTLDTNTSGTTGSLGVTASASGTLVGQYDPDTNPDGTRTRVTGNPFSFPGPTQNDPVPTSVGLPLNVNLDAMTGGGFGLELNGASASLSGLALDLLASGPVSASINADLSFSSFTTANPTSFYPGVPLSLPLGDASVDTLLATQTGGPTIGSATLVGANLYDVVFAVPVLIEGSASFQGQSVPIAPIPGVLPFTGQLSTDPGSPFFMGAFDVEFMDAVALDVALPELPLPLPTLFGDTADVTLALTLDELGLDIDLAGAFNATGVEVPSPACAVVLMGVFVRRRRRSA